MAHLKFLIMIIVLAFLPPTLTLINVGDTAVTLVGIIWIATAVAYYRRVRRRQALWIFVLLPVAFGPFIYSLLIVIGVLLSRGRF